MIISIKHKLGFICVPKCATTSIENLLKPYADIHLFNYGMKHMAYSEIQKYLLPLLANYLKDSYIHFFSTIRHPVDWLFSWYRYQARELLANPKHPKHEGRFTGNMSFDDFIELSTISLEAPPSIAPESSQSSYFKDLNGKFKVDSLIPYDHINELLPSLLKKFNIYENQLPFLNKSPQDIKIKLTHKQFNKIISFYHEDLEIYNSTLWKYGLKNKLHKNIDLI